MLSRERKLTALVLQCAIYDTITINRILREYMIKTHRVSRALSMIMTLCTSFISLVMLAVEPVSFVLHMLSSKTTPEQNKAICSTAHRTIRD